MRGAVVVAGGGSSRYGKNKLAEEILGNGVLSHGVATLCACADKVVVVTSDDDLKRQLADFDVVFASGGKTRSASVKNGLAALGKCSLVAIHDGARPFVSRALVDKLFDEAGKFGSAVPVVPVSDTVYLSDGSKTIDRETLRAAQTPQVFDFDKLTTCLASGGEFTDEGQAYAALYGSVHLVCGEKSNFKLTFSGDLPQFRAGIGFDVHRLADGGKLILGGVVVQEGRHLVGHSDADVLTHAVMDAVLSASGNDDIGHQFPDTDDAYLGADSIELCKQVRRIAEESLCEVVNVSAVVAAQSPKLAPFLPLMAERIAKALGISSALVNLTATTTEKLGVVGDEKGVSATATALVRRLG